jgi:pilus assembly protein CpaE
LADAIILVTTQDIPAIKNSKTFLNLVDAMQYDRQRVAMVLNRFDKRISISPEKVGESLRQEVVTVIPFEEKIVVTAMNRGVPFMLENKTQPIGKAIQSLADLIRDRIAKLENPELERIGKR